MFPLLPRLTTTRRLTPWLMLGVDLLMLAATFMASYLLAEAFSNWLQSGVEFVTFTTTLGRQVWFWLFLAQSGLLLAYLASHGHYTQRLPWWEQTRHILITTLLMLGIAGFILYALKLPFSRLWITCCWLIAMPALAVGRLLTRNISQHLGEWSRPVVIVGGATNVQETLYAMFGTTLGDYQLHALWLLGSAKKLPPAELPQPCRSVTQLHPTQADLATLLSQLPKGTLVVLAPEDLHQLERTGLIALVTQAGLEYAIVPPLKGISLYGMAVTPFFGSHTVLLTPRQTVGSPLNQLLKRGLDITGALGGFLVLGLPMLLIALLVRRDGGPALYAQTRVGRHGVPFRCWKFRSMLPNAEQILTQLLASNPEAKAEWDRDFKLKNDPRITHLGHLIRKTSIDELPQLWNVLKGDMSLVGPRPIVPAELEYYGTQQATYLQTKPGLTGLWQVSGRNDTTYTYRVYLDSWYAANWSLWTDLVIICKTVGILLNRRGAY